MSRTRSQFAVATAVLTVFAATSAVAQATDSARAAPPRPEMRGRMGLGGGLMGPRFGFGQERGRMRGDAGPRRPRSAPGGREAWGPQAPGMGAGRFGGAGPRAFLRGITLSVDQEKALRANQAKQILSTKPLLMEMLSARTDEQLARLNGDQKALDAATARASATRTKLDSLRTRRSPIDDLRSVLTPDQQKLLDRNLSEMADGRGPGRLPAVRGGMGQDGIPDGVEPRPFRARGVPRRPGEQRLEPFDDQR